MNYKQVLSIFKFKLTEYWPNIEINIYCYCTFQHLSEWLTCGRVRLALLLFWKPRVEVSVSTSARASSTRTRSKLCLGRKGLMSRRLPTTPTGLHKQHSVLCPALSWQCGLFWLSPPDSNVPVGVGSTTQVLTATAADRTAKDVLEDKGQQRSTRHIPALVGDKVD